jgi:hypothetical protein
VVRGLPETGAGPPTCCAMITQVEAPSANVASNAFVIVFILHIICRQLSFHCVASLVKSDYGTGAG